VTAVFPFPGGKARLASWVIDHLPSHECYVELFGGAGSVLINKPDAEVEVYNDKDGDLVHFFEVLRDDPEGLVEWLDAVPYSRELHEEWVDAFYKGYRPTDKYARAGRFFFLRYSQWGACYDSPGGFGTSKVQNQAQTFANKVAKLESFADELSGTVIEHLDWETAVEKYDQPETVFYADPPYVGVEDYYPQDDVVHEGLLERLQDIEGEAVISYSDLPPGAEDYWVVGKDSSFVMNAGQSGQAKDCREHLLLTFDPESRETP
jgi:DNA adenine methylase